MDNMHNQKFSMWSNQTTYYTELNMEWSVEVKLKRVTDVLKNWLFGRLQARI